MIAKMKLIFDLHKSILNNNAQAQVQQQKTCVLQKIKQLFPYFKVGIHLGKMNKPCKKKSFVGSWEGLYFFVGYVDEQVTAKHDDGRRNCIIRSKDKQMWEHLSRDLQLYY